MKNLLLLIVISMSLIACKDEDNYPDPHAHIPHTHAINLQVDSFTTGDPAFQSGFVSGEAAAVTLGPVANSFQITSVKFLLGGTVVPETKDVILKIYTDEGNTDPDSLLFNSTFNLTSSNDILQEIDLTSHNISVAGGKSIRVAVETGNGLPSVAEDDDGTIDSARNWIYTGGTWNTSLQMGLSSDFIIRAVVEETI